nr:hypothetical protein [Methylobacterium frigidaeris]
MLEQPGLRQDRGAAGLREIDGRIEVERARDPVEHPDDVLLQQSSRHQDDELLATRLPHHAGRAGRREQGGAVDVGEDLMRAGAHQRRTRERDLEQEEAVEAAGIDLDPRAVGDEVDRQAAEGRGMVPRLEPRGAAGSGEDQAVRAEDPPDLLARQVGIPRGHEGVARQRRGGSHGRVRIGWLLVVHGPTGRPGPRRGECLWRQNLHKARSLPALRFLRKVDNANVWRIARDRTRLEYSTA